MFLKIEDNGIKRCFIKTDFTGIPSRDILVAVGTGYSERSGNPVVFTLSLLTNDEVIDVNQDPLGVHGAPILKTVRDLWRQKDVAETDDKHTVTVNPHGAVMLRIY